jgi:hypothetical protein
MEPGLEGAGPVDGKQPDAPQGAPRREAGCNDMKLQASSFELRGARHRRPCKKRAPGRDRGPGRHGGQR